MKHRKTSFKLLFKRLLVLEAIFTLFLLSGCKGPQSTLDPAGTAALGISQLWWGMLIFSTFVLIGMILLWLYAIREKNQEMDKKQTANLGNYLIIGGGISFPMMSIVLLLIFGIPIGHRMLPLVVHGNTPLHINVIGHQWWWEIVYPETGIKLINELHLPVGCAIDIHASSGDVIHSFWVPRLSGKIDMIPGRTNIIRLNVSKTGYFRAQCAEFCGLFHARMILAVFAHKADDFIAWQKRKQASMPSVSTAKQLNLSNTKFREKSHD